MPSSNGVYSLPPGYLAVTGSTIQASQHNPPLEDIAAALTLRLSRDGSAPMTGALQAAVGSVTLPGVVFQTDASSGFYKTTNGIGVAVGGTKVAEFLAGGVSGARFLGELIPFSLSAAPALTVFPVGQTLSRVTYAALWTQAQIEIAAGNTFYNNGDGSTTFGVGDMRGRVAAANDAMGGTAASRLTSTYFGTTVALGAVGGSQSHTLTLGETPSNITSSGTTTVTGSGGDTPLVLKSGFSLVNVNVSGTNTAIEAGAGSNSIGNTNLTGSGTYTSNNTGGNPHSIVPPILVCNYLLFAGA